MYKPIDKSQHSFLDFNQPMGLHMNPDNRWIKMAGRIPWDTTKCSIENEISGFVTAWQKSAGASFMTL